MQEIPCLTFVKCIFMGWSKIWYWGKNRLTWCYKSIKENQNQHFFRDEQICALPFSPVYPIFLSQVSPISISGTWFSVFVSNVRATAVMAKVVRQIYHASGSKGPKAQNNLSEGKAKQGSDRKHKRKKKGRGRSLARKRQGKKRKRGFNRRQVVHNKKKIMRETRSSQDRKICTKGKPNKSAKCQKRRARRKRTRGKRLSVIWQGFSQWCHFYHTM